MALTREEAQGWMVQMLLDKIRRDRFPSATQMAIVEESLPPEMIPDYLEVLIEKADQDNVPSIPMLRRISRIAAMLPPGDRNRGNR
jgi:hypothetical protein